VTKPKHIPTRTCVACRETDQKRELLRIVRLPDGSVQYDAKGKISGRGAYVCATSDCLGAAQKGRKFERSLKVAVCPPELWAALRERLVPAQSVTTGTPDAAGRKSEEENGWQ
jgi:uncharacterized protein